MRKNLEEKFSSDCVSSHPTPTLSLFINFTKELSSTLPVSIPKLHRQPNCPKMSLFVVERVGIVIASACSEIVLLGCKLKWKVDGGVGGRSKLQPNKYSLSTTVQPINLSARMKPSHVFTKLLKHRHSCSGALIP